MRPRTEAELPKVYFLKRLAGARAREEEGEGGRGRYPELRGGKERRPGGRLGASCLVLCSFWPTLARCSAAAVHYRLCMRRSAHCRLCMAQCRVCVAERRTQSAAAAGRLANCSRHRQLGAQMGGGNAAGLAGKGRQRAG